jgi:hypothetical protein
MNRLTGESDMPSIEDGLDENGLAKVQVILRQKQGQDYLKSFRLTGALDSCANHVVGTRGLRDICCFQASGSSTIEQVESTHVSVAFEAEICILNAGGDDCWIPLVVCQSPRMPAPGCHLLLGWTFLRHCVFVYDGPGNRFTLNWERPNE